MPIFRQKHTKQHPYLIILRKTIQNKKLSWKARGLLTYLLSLPDDWKVSQKNLEDQASDGENSLRSGMKELIEVGHVVRTWVRNEKGRIVDCLYDIYESPIKKAPEGASEPGRDCRDPETCQCNNIKSKDNKESKPKKETTPKKLNPDLERANELSRLFLATLNDYQKSIGILPSKPQSLQSWLKACLSLVKQYNLERVIPVMQYTFKSWWTKAISSPGGLLKNFTKIETQLAEDRMKKKSKLTTVEQEKLCQRLKDYSARIREDIPNKNDLEINDDHVICRNAKIPVIISFYDNDFRDKLKKTFNIQG